MSCVLFNFTGEFRSLSFKGYVPEVIFAGILKSNLVVCYICYSPKSHTNRFYIQLCHVINTLGGKYKQLAGGEAYVLEAELLASQGFWLVVQEYRTALNSSGSCSRGTPIILPGNNNHIISRATFWLANGCTVKLRILTASNSIMKYIALQDYKEMNVLQCWVDYIQIVVHCRLDDENCSS